MRAVAAALAFLAVSGPVFADDGPEARVKDAAVAFLKTLKTRDVDAVMKLVDVPFLYRDMENGRKAASMKDAAAVKAWLSERLEKVKDTDAIPTEVDEVMSVAELRGKIKDPADRALTDEVLGKDGYLAVIKTPDGLKAGVAVRLRDGKTKVVGVVQ